MLADNKSGDPWSGARPKLLNIGAKSGSEYKESPPPLPIPPPPADSATESDLSDDDNVNVVMSATDYDNMYSTDNGTYNRVGLPKPKEKLANAPSKFASKLEHMQNPERSIRDLYSEVESDTADCDSLVGDTDYETESHLVPPISHDYSHPLQRLQWTENRLLALLKPTATGWSTAGSSLRHCRSMELLPTDTDTYSRRFQRRINPPSNRGSQHLDDNVSIHSSMLGSELSRSDPYLSDCGAYSSEYDNYNPASNDNIFSQQPNNPLSISNFGDIDFDKIKINESLTTEDYIETLQQQIDRRQRPRVVTDV